MPGFAQVLADARPSGQGRSVAVPETWHQGRTAYGGFSSALALAEAMRIGGDLPPLRSAQVAMMAPLHGEVEVRAEVVRQGRNARWVEARIFGDKGLGLTASFVFMGAVASTLDIADCPPPADLIAVESARPFVNARSPAFLHHHFDVRFALPRADVRKPEACWWVRPREGEGLDPTMALMLTADGLPPAVMTLLATTVPVSTMHWQVNLLTSAPVTRDGWWLLRSTADHAQAGGSSQRMAAWNADGAAVAAGVQSIALFG